MFLLLRATGNVTDADLTTNHEVERIAHPKLIEVLVSACAAGAGVIMITAFRRSVIAGPLIALVLIPAAATVGAALGAGEGRLAVQALQRLGLDGALIVGLGALVFGAKQLITHRRASIV